MIPAALTRTYGSPRAALCCARTLALTPPAGKPSVHPPTGGMYIIGKSAAQQSAKALSRYKQCTSESADVHFEE